MMSEDRKERIVAMKKCIAVCLTFILLSVGFTSCNRRDQYRDPIDTGTPDHGTVTEAPTETSSDTPADKAPESSVQLTEGNPYESMSPEELLTMYRSTSDYTEYSSDIVANTPYYYIFSLATFGNGGQAYSKLTGNIVTLCKDLACDHYSDTCLFYGQIDECMVLGDRIYLLMEMFEGGYRLYSFNLMLDDVKQVYEWNELDFPDCFSVHQGMIYMIGGVLKDDGRVSFSLFVFDPQTNTCSAATDPNFTFQSGRGLGRYLYYTASDGALWQYDIDTEERKCLLKASLLNPEDGDVRFIVVGRAGTSHLMVLRQSVTANSVLYYDLSTGETMTKESFMDEETGELNAWNQTGQYFFLKHNTPAYKDDPHYTYYNDKVENWLVNYSGGEIWYRKSADDELTLLATLTTNDIPDAIRSIVAMDGKTLVVEYSTYEDFDNVYNGYQKITGINWELRYAVIDMETGIVYKNGAVYS